jgi:hypothetical protein
MGAMRERMSKLKQAAMSRNFRVYAAVVSLIVAFFLLLTISQRGESTGVQAVPSRFLFSAGTFAAYLIVM